MISDKKIHVLVVALCLICITIALAIHFSPGEKAKRHVSIGDELFSKGQIEEAKKEADLALSITNKNPYAFLLLGKIYIKQKEYDQALDSLKKSGELLPELAETCYYKAIAARGQKNFTEALKYLEEAEKKNEKEKNKSWDKLIKEEKVNVYIEEGELLYLEGEEEKSKAKIKKALKIGDKDGETHYKLSIMYISIDRLDLAMEECKNTIRLKPSLGADAFYRLIKSWKAYALKEETIDNYKKFYKELAEITQNEKDTIIKELLSQVKIFAENELKNMEKEDNGGKGK